jgi:putative membrane protein
LDGLARSENMGAMADSQAAPDSPEVAASTRDVGAASRTGMAAERTWLAWWRTALGATAGALGIGRFAPQVLHTAPAPYVVLGCGYALLAIALLLVGAHRQRGLQGAIERDEEEQLPFPIVAGFTAGGIGLAVMTVVLVLIQT